MEKPTCPTCGKNPAIMHPTYGITACRSCVDKRNAEYMPQSPSFAPLDLSKKGKRLNHWKEITTRIRTHEGELLSGNKGVEYTQKYGKKYLGIDPRPVNFNSVSFQKELAKTK